MLDETVAWNDALTEHFPRCIVCGRAARCIDTMLIGSLILAVSRCVRCFGQDREGDKLIARLAERERPGF